MDFYAKDPDAFMSNDPNVHALVIPETGKYFWEKPTTKEYPEIDAPEKFRIEVSVADQRVYIFRDDKKVCTLICSTGATNSPTVTGDFELFAKRGDTFYTERFGGGNYWITFYKTYFIAFPREIIETFKELSQQNNSVKRHDIRYGSAAADVHFAEFDRLKDKLYFSYIRSIRFYDGDVHFSIESNFVRPCFYFS